MPGDEKSKWTLGTWLQLGGLSIAVVAVFVTVFFSVRSERTKELTVTYLAKRPLVSIDGTRPSVGLEVRLGGNPIVAPWLVSGRLENTGNQPIEERDVEAPAKLSFPRAKIVGAEIVQRSQPAIFANTGFKANDVTIEHKLLNPGDWLSFDVVFDGEPEIPASLTFRITGVAQPIQRVISPGERRTYPAVVPLPTPLLYLLLTIGSLTGVGLVVVGAVLFGQSIGNIFPVHREPPSSEQVLSPFNTPRLARRLQPSGRAARTVFALLAEPISLDLLDQPDRLRPMIEQQVPPAVFEALGLDAQSATTTLSVELKEDLKRYLARQLYSMLPSGPDREAQAELEKLDAKAMSAGSLVERATEMATEAGLSSERGARVDTGELAGGFALFAIGISLIILLGGTWRTVLSV